MLKKLFILKVLWVSAILVFITGIVLGFIMNSWVPFIVCLLPTASLVFTILYFGYKMATNLKQDISNEIKNLGLENVLNEKREKKG